MPVLTQRTVDVVNDRDALLEFHCASNHESETPWAREVPYDTYRSEWLATSQTETFLASLARAMQDQRTIAEIWEKDGEIVGYIWVGFQDIDGYGLSFAEVHDIGVVPEHRRRGIGLAMLQRAERQAKERGAAMLRSDTGIENVASQALHARHGFYQNHVGYEKLLVDKSSLTGRGPSFQEPGP